MTGGPAQSAPISRSAGRVRDGGAMVWLLALALVFASALILSLIALVAYHGSRTFWPTTIEHIKVEPTEFDDPLYDAPEFLGVRVREESYEPYFERVEGIQSLIDQGELPSSALNDKDELTRRLYLIGNREFDGVSFRWVDLHTIEISPAPDGAMLFERTDWGMFLGMPEAAVHPENRVDLSGPDAAAKIKDLMAQARARILEIKRLEREGSTPINRELKDLALERTRVEMQRSEDSRQDNAPMPSWIWAIALVGGLAGTGWVAVTTWRRRSVETDPRIGARVIAVVGAVLLLLAWLENPWSNATPDAASIDERLAEIDAQVHELREEGQRVGGRDRRHACRGRRAPDLYPRGSAPIASRPRNSRRRTRRCGSARSSASCPTSYH